MGPKRIGASPEPVHPEKPIFNIGNAIFPAAEEIGRRTAR